MRIIAGTCKGFRLKMVPGSHVRPTSDRVKESLFQILGPYFEGGWVLDLFAGTGALGLESLSRGVEKAVFVDRSRASLKTIERNSQEMGMNKRIELIQLDAKKAIRLLIEKKKQFSMIFLDPPYDDHHILLAVLTLIAKSELLYTDGVVVVEHSFKKGNLPLQIDRLEAYRQLHVGEVMITLYQL